MGIYTDWLDREASAERRDVVFALRAQGLLPDRVYVDVDTEGTEGDAFAIEFNYSLCFRHEDGSLDGSTTRCFESYQGLRDYLRDYRDHGVWRKTTPSD